MTSPELLLRHQPIGLSLPLTRHTASENVFIQFSPFLSPEGPAFNSPSEQSSDKSLLFPRECILLPRKISFTIYSYSGLKWFISIYSWFFVTGHPVLSPQALSIPCYTPQPPRVGGVGQWSGNCTSRNGHTERLCVAPPQTSGRVSSSWPQQPPRNGWAHSPIYTRCCEKKPKKHAQCTAGKGLLGCTSAGRWLALTNLTLILYKTRGSFQLEKRTNCNSKISQLYATLIKIGFNIGSNSKQMHPLKKNLYLEKLLKY